MNKYSIYIYVSSNPHLKHKLQPTQLNPIMVVYKMTAANKVTFKNIGDEFEKLRQEVHELRPLRRKVADLEE
jgi:hypothetical protein